MSSDTEQVPFWEATNVGFSPPTAGCDLLHPEITAVEHDPALTETQYFGFSVPEARIHALCYLWHHPNLRVVTGGAWAWRGVKGGHLEAELFDMVTYASDGCLAGDLHDYELPNGYHVTTLEPMRKHRIRYEDPARGRSIDVELEAIMPAMVLGNGHHLEQAMRTTGRLTLAGEEHAIAGFTVRDRTWGELRKDTLQPPMPPIEWMTGAFGEDFAFGCTALDSVDRDPHWKGLMEPPPGDPLKLGWVFRDGALTPLVSAQKLTRRSLRTLYPESVEMEVVDADGRRYEIQGTVIASCPWNAWQTQESVICSTRWECDGRTTHGDLQSGLRPEYIRMFRGQN